MAVVSTLLSATSGATSLVQKGGSILSLAGATAALVKPQNTVKGIDGLVFSIPENETLQLQAAITDHAVEDNSMRQDHVTIQPIRVTLVGKVSELVLTKSKIEQYAETVLNALTTIGVLSPAFSTSAAQTLARLQRTQQATEQTLNKLNNIKDIVSGNPTRTKQQQYYLEIKQFFYGRSLLTVETPWETFENMAIESVSFDQDETTSEWTSVTVSLKQITLAKTKQLTTEIKGRIKIQKAAVSEKGTVRGKDKSFAAAGVDNALGFVKKIYNAVVPQ